MEKKGFSKEEKSWILYDWANSAYSMVVTSTIFTLYYKLCATKDGIDKAVATSNLGFANSIYTLLLFIISPVLGTIADYRGFKKKFFVFFTLLGVGFTGLMAFLPSNKSILLLIIYMVTSLGFSGANIFYDSFLTDTTTPERMDKVSTFGFALGYIGSTIPFIICMMLVILSQPMGNNPPILPIGTERAMQISFLITAFWWGIFSIPIIKNVSQKYFIEKEDNYIKKSFERLFDTFKNIMKYKKVFIFLLAYFFYIDGVDTIIKMATAYGSDLGIKDEMLLIILLVTQFVAFPCAIIYGKLAEKFGATKMIMTAIIIYIFVCIYALFLKTEFDFWVLAMMVGSSQGGIQALSRSHFSKIIPTEKSNQFFGFYNIFGKFAAVMGPALLAIITRITDNTRYGVFSIIILFIAGGSIFFKFCLNENYES